MSSQSSDFGVVAYGRYAHSRPASGLPFRVQLGPAKTRGGMIFIPPLSYLQEEGAKLKEGMHDSALGERKQSPDLPTLFLHYRFRYHTFFGWIL